MALEWGAHLVRPCQPLQPPFPTPILTMDPKRQKDAAMRFLIILTALALAVLAGYAFANERAFDACLDAGGSLQNGLCLTSE